MSRRIPGFSVLLLILLVGCAPVPEKTVVEPVEPLPEPVAEPEVTEQDVAPPSDADAQTDLQPAPDEVPEPAVEPEPATQDTLPAELTLIATGDMMLGGSGTEFYRRDNYDYAFANVGEYLREADIFLGNIETALTHSDELLVEKKYRFRNPPDAVADALARAGLDVGNLANNHSLDYGYSGLQDTLVALNSRGMATIGAGASLADARRPVVMDHAAGKIGFLAYSNTFPPEFWADEARGGTAFGHEHHVRADVASLIERGVDMIVVSFHWGREGTTELREYQPLLAHAAIDAGADVVVGHHPHILQAVERYRDGVIFYSLGNFTFGSYSRRARDSAMARIRFRQGRLAQVELIPIDVYNPRVLFQPVVLEGPAATAVVSQLQALSDARGTRLEHVEGRAVITWPAP